MMADELLNAQDLITAKKHDTFHSEVITGKTGGISTGANIDYATNAVTGQVQKTLPKLLSNVGFSPAGFDFTTGGTLTERDKAIFYQDDGNWYSWGGTLPKVVPPASSPTSTGGIADNAWNVSTSAFMYRDWEGFTAELLAQGGVPDNGLPDVLGASKRVDAMRKIFSNVGTVADIASGKFKVGARVAVTDRGNGIFLVESGGTPNGYWRLGAGGGNTAVLTLNDDEPILMSYMGAVEGQDQTLEGQAALDYSEFLGGGRDVVMVAGDVIISNVTSQHPKACWVIPANTRLMGHGQGVTIVTRPPAERSVDGILIANKYYNTEVTPFGASGGIELCDFTITDGVPSPTRSAGDLIAIGNCENVLVHDIESGAHDQHFVDIAGCRNVHVYRCKGVNTSDGMYTRSATVQVDGAGGMEGAINTGVVSEDIYIYDNDFDTTTSQELIHLCHKPQSQGVFKNINIYNNKLKGGRKEFHSIFFVDSNSAVDGLNIWGNECETFHAGATGINLVWDGTTGSGDIVKNVKIYNNTVKGLNRVPIYFGVASTAFATYPAEMTNIDIHHNIIDVSSDTIYGMFTGILGVNNAKYTDNIINLTRSSGLNEIIGIRVSRCEDAEVARNKVNVQVADLNAGNVSGKAIYGIQYDVKTTTVTSSNVDIHSNEVDQSSVRYGVVITSIGNYSKLVDKVKVRANVFKGDLLADASTASLYDEFSASDLTNGATNVIFNAGTGTENLAVVAAKTTAVLGYGGIKSFQGKVRLEPSFVRFTPAPVYDKHMPMQLAGGFSGTSLQEITKDSFKIQTGALGVNTILDGTGAAQPVASGTLSVKAFI